MPGSAAASWRGRAAIEVGLVLFGLAVDGHLGVAAVSDQQAGARVMSAAGRGEHSLVSFARVRTGTQFIAADPGMQHPSASTGAGASGWGIWHQDPGPRGVPLADAGALEANGTAPAGWAFDSDEFWLEEHGLIMEKPESPLPEGSYTLSWLNGPRAGESVTLAIENGQWSLDSGATLHDVTHLPCRAAAYHGGSPSSADENDFPVAAGASMPVVPGCSKVDYAVLFVQ